MHHVYTQKGVLYPQNVSRDRRSHCKFCLCTHRFHHWTLVVVTFTECKHSLISLPPLPGTKGVTLLNHMVGIRQQRYHDKLKDHKVSDDVYIRSPTKKHHKDFLCVGYQQVIEGKIMTDVGDGVNLKKLARARLDNLATSTTTHNENSSWLYHLCTDTIKK